MICLTWRMCRFQQKILQMVIWSENVFKRNMMLQFSRLRGISLGKGFWVLNTWRAPVWKLLKRSTLNYAHTFPIACWTKTCPFFFSNNEPFIFHCKKSTSFKSIFAWKQLKVDYSKNTWKERKSRERFSFFLGWL